MLVLFETAAGFALFKLLDEQKLQKSENLFNDFQDLEKAQKIISLQKFASFKNTADALKSASKLVESKLSKTLKKFLKKEILDKGLQETLLLQDSKLGGAIKENLGIQCLNDSSVNELMRGIRSQLENLLGELSQRDFNAMSLGLSHSLSRYKLKFSSEKVDTMIVQAIGLLDDLDKELNTYSMRVREWYGWHFPELNKIISDNIVFAKTASLLGMRTNTPHTDLSEILPEEIIQQVKDAAQISMGTEVSDEDIDNIKELCTQVISISEYREQLYEYLKNRMHAIAPNLTILVGELVGARLIAHAGSLLNLAKHPASTVQILGAEKALFRALKTKKETPKYGLIFHASLVGQTPPKLKGKISRVLAAKASLATRYDALGEGEQDSSLGTEGRSKVEQRLKDLESGQTYKLSGTRKAKSGNHDKYDSKRTDNYIERTTETEYDASMDTTMTNGNHKRKASEGSNTPPDRKKKKY